jgi:hypothetical protein
MTTTIKKIPHNIKTTGDIGICGTCNSELDFEVRKECISCKECASCRKSFNCWRGFEDYCNCEYKYRKIFYVLFYECGKPKTSYNRHLLDEYDLIKGEWRNDA